MWDLLDRNNKKTLTRQELYDLVWSIPMRDLAKQFDISDRGLAKKCETHKIPRPPQGYWLKNEQGRKLLVKPLPANNDTWLDTIDFFPKPESLKESLKAKSTLTDDQLVVALEFRIPKTVTRYHPIISRCRREARKPRLDKYSRIEFPRNTVNPGFKVTTATFDRACLFLQGLVTLFASYGWKLKEAGDRAFFEYKDIGLEFEIKERVAKKAELEPNPYKGFDALSWTPQYFKSTGKLEFRITNAHATGYKKSWYDTETSQIEDQLGSIVQGFSRGFEDRRLWQIEHEKQRRLQEEEEAERREQARLWRIEQERQKHLFDLAEQYHKAKSVRDFLAAIQAASDKPEGMVEWLDWANAVIDEIDPLCEKEKIIERHTEIAAPPKPLWD